MSWNCKFCGRENEDTRSNCYHCHQTWTSKNEFKHLPTYPYKESEED